MGGVIFMVAKKAGISPDLLIHPGETISDVLAERNITREELAARTGFIAGERGISSDFAVVLENALGVPKRRGWGSTVNE